MSKKLLALAAMYSALGELTSSGIPYVPVPDVTNPNPYRHKQCKSCKLFEQCYINKCNDPKQQACANYVKRK